jgi:hypothetical protein
LLYLYKYDKIFNNDLNQGVKMSLSIKINNNQIEPLLKLDLTPRKGEKTKPIKLTFANTVITNELLEILSNKKITDLIFTDCIMSDEAAELFATSKKSVEFTNCILTDLETVHDERISHMLIRKSKDGMDAYNLQLLTLAENFHKLPPETIEKLDALEQVQSFECESNRNNELMDQISIGKKIIEKFNNIIINNKLLIEDIDEDDKIINKLKEKQANLIFIVNNIDKVIERYNQSTDSIDMLLASLVEAIKKAQTYIEESEHEPFTPS